MKAFRKKSKIICIDFESHQKSSRRHKKVLFPLNVLSPTVKNGISFHDAINVCRLIATCSQYIGLFVKPGLEDLHRARYFRYPRF